jgi:phenylpropionate dioxygenase-like ring-hydroxylating dioxygenase large terminal subunit
MMIPNRWYPILQSSRLKTNKPVGVMRLGRRLVLWRAVSGEVIAMPDRCSHRAAALSTGKIRDGCLECPYHGLRFDHGGKCVLIPANGSGAPVPRGFDISPVAVREEHGLVWQWHGEEAPSSEVGWIDEIAEESGTVRSYSWEFAIPHLRVTENLLDFHHFNFVHRWSFPGVGPRIDNYDAHLDGEMVVMSGTLRHERTGWLRPSLPFRALCKLPALAHIELFGASINYAMTPIDDAHTWIWARYAQDRIPRYLGAGLLAAFSARLDRAVFLYQDAPVLNSQSDPPGDFSRFHLYEADHGIALFFGMRKRAMLAAASQEHHATAAAGR